MSNFSTFQTFIQERPLNVIAWKLYCKLFNTRIPNFKAWKALVDGKSGLEIGGPSGIFSKDKFLPIYPFIKTLDGVNFSAKTIWEGELKEGPNYGYDGRLGYQFIAEATDLKLISDNKYDFVLSSNNLEHIANPLKAVSEWKRVIKPQGIIILILPRKESNFDHHRSVTTFDHLLKDYQDNIGEDDLSHLDEILKCHDVKRDPHAISLEEFTKRSMSNFETRSIHHHVFDIGLLKQLFKYLNIQVIHSYSSPTDHFIAGCKTTSDLLAEPYNRNSG